MEMIAISKTRWEDLFKDTLNRLALVQFRQRACGQEEIAIIDDIHRKFVYEISQFKQLVESQLR